MNTLNANLHLTLEPELAVTNKRGNGETSEVLGDAEAGTQGSAKVGSRGTAYNDGASLAWDDPKIPGYGHEIDSLLLMMILKVQTTVIKRFHPH